MSDMIPDEIMEMLPEFLQESDEHLQILNEKMLIAETTIKNGAAMSTDDLNTMFRSAHTIKGTASFIGLKKVVALTHKAETLLQQLRDAEIVLNGQIVDALFSAFDTLTNLLKSLKENKTEGVDIDTDVQRIEKILDPNSAPAASAADVKKPQPEVAAAPAQPPVVIPEGDFTSAASATPAAASSPAAAVPVSHHPAEPKLQPLPSVKPVQPAKPAAPEPPKDEGIIERYLEQFIAELEQNIDLLNVNFLKVEEEPSNVDIVHEIFRTMHSIKGSAGLVNAKPIAEVAHKLENILDYFRSQNKPLPKELVATFFKGVDAIKAMVDSLKATRKIDFDIVPVCKVIDKCSIKVVLEMKVGAKPANVPPAPQAPKLQDVNVDWANLSKDIRAVVDVELSQGKDIYIVQAIISAREAIKSMRQTMMEGRLNKNGKVAASFPAPDELDKIKIDAMVCFLFCSNINESNIREILAMDGVTVRDVEKADNELTQIIVGAKEEDKVEVAPFAQPAKDVSPAKPAAVQPAAVAAPVKEEHKPQQAAAASSNTPVEISTVKIDARKLDKLMNLSGELVIIRSQYARLVGLFNNDVLRQKEVVNTMEHTFSMVTELEKECSAANNAVADMSRIQKMVEEIKVNMHKLAAQSEREELTANFHTLSETTSALEKTASDLQASVMQTRMVPVEGVFTRFKRIVRDISKDLNKEVNLKIEGAETELDKKIIDGLGDPLTHMIRNAVDHGLEDAEERARTAKNPVGTILLKASHRGNSICIEISDDGRGMDPEKIAAIAVKKGVINQEQSMRMSDKEKLNLIFLPGFSTAQKVTGLSGRGVGMDVVRSMIASFNGVVDINTKIGMGSTFVLKIPLTLAIIQALLVVVGDEVYALPLDAVIEIIKVPKKDIYYVDGNATVKLRNHALSLIELSKVINVKPNKELDEDYKRLVIITDGENRLGVQVDSLVGKDEIVIKSFTKHFSRVKGVIGASILADGNVALILDPATIIKESR